MPWLRHNGCSGNLPNLMMPVWPRREEVESRNPKEAHSCTDPSLPIFTLSLSVSLCSLITKSCFFHFLEYMTQLMCKTNFIPSFIFSLKLTFSVGRQEEKQLAGPPSLSYADKNINSKWKTKGKTQKQQHTEKERERINWKSLILLFNYYLGLICLSDW